MKQFTEENTIDFPWESIAQATWRKYPNPFNNAVFGIDVIDRKVENGVLHSHRLLQSTWGFPKWTKGFIGEGDICYASERSELDPNKREIVQRTKNVSIKPLNYGKLEPIFLLSLCNYVAFDETVTYKPHPEDANKTLQIQKTVVVVKGVPLSHYMEDLCASIFSKNAQKGRQALKWVIETLETDVKDLASSAVKTTDELVSETRRQMDHLTSKTKQSMDDLQSAAKKSFDDIHNLTTPPSSQSMPKF